MQAIELQRAILGPIALGRAVRVTKEREPGQKGENGGYM